MPRTTGQQRRGGRILPHQRDTNDAVAILGEDLDDIGTNFQQNYNDVKNMRWVTNAEGNIVVG